MRKLCFHHAAVGVLDSDRAAGQAGDRMQDAEAAAIGLESAFGKRAHVENQLAVGGAFDRRAKVEPASLRSDTACRIADSESVGALVDDQIRQRRLVGAPVAIPDDVGDGAQHLDTAMADGAQIAVDEVGS